MAMELPDIIAYLNLLAKGFDGKVTLSAEGHHNKFMLSLPKRGIHVFALSRYEHVDEQKLSKHFNKAVRALGGSPVTL